MILPLLFMFIIGLCVGSFFNVVIFRYETKRKINGRSKCQKCKKQLKWYHMFPLFSFLFLRGKCAYCNKKLSYQYPIVEFVTGFLFALGTFVHLPFMESFPFMFIILTAFFAVIQALYVAIFVYDIRHKIIPDPWVFALIDLSFVYALFYLLTVSVPMTTKILHLMAGPLLYLVIFSLWYVSKGKWIGLGDAKLFLAVGFFLGMSQGITAFFLSFWIGAFVGVVLMLIRPLSKKFKKITSKTEIPFAPFIIVATLLSFYFGIDLFTLS